LAGSFGNHGGLKYFIKAASYDLILLQKKDYITEAVVESDINSPSTTSMTTGNIPKAKLKKIFTWLNKWT
jgi:hypothetical protein